MLVSVFILVFLLPELSVANVEYICNNATVPGDLQITLLANQHFGASCDKSSPTTVLNPLSANIIEWSRKVLPDSTNISLRIIDSCGNAETVTKAITELIPWSSISSTQAVCTVDSGSTSIGVITTVQPINHDITNLLSEADIPLIVAQDGLYGEVSSNQTSTFSLGHSNDITVKMMSEFMVALKWDFVTVVYSDDVIGMESLKAFEKITPTYHLCIDKAVAVDSSLNIPEINTNGVLYLGSQSIGLGLLTKNDLKSKIWVTSLDVKGLDLDTNGKVYSVIRSDGDPIIDSLALLGKAINSAYSLSGCDAGNLEACTAGGTFKSNLQMETKKLTNKPMTYTINVDGSINEAATPEDITYNVFSRTNEMVAKVSSSAGVTKLAAFKEEPSLCKPSANNCMAKCGHLNQEYLYSHGEWVIVVSLPIRKEVDQNNRWSCVGFTQSGLFRAEAASFAMKKLKEEYHKDGEKSIGLLVIDSCGDKLKTGGLMYNILSGNEKICDKNGDCFDHNTVVAVVGDFSSAVTQQMQTILKVLPALQISYGASSVVLNDRSLFPYFLRSIPPDNVQAHFMVELLKKIAQEPGSEVNAVNIIYTDGLYGRTGAEGVKSALVEANICVRLERKVNETYGNNFTNLVEDILYNTEDVKFIVLFLDPPHVRNLMDAINSNLFRERWKRQGFSLILSDTWNDDPELLDKYGSIAKGSFSFKFNADFKSTTAKAKLQSRLLATIDQDNPWLSTLEQEYGGCKIRGNFMSEYDQQCTSPSDFSGLTEEAYALHLMKTLTAVTVSIKNMEYLHGRSNPGYLFDPNTIAERYDAVLEVKIPKELEGGYKDQIPFTQRSADSDTYGNGRVGYTIYNIQEDGDPAYVEILQTGKLVSDDLGEFEEVVIFYVGDSAKKFITSIDDQCHVTSMAPAASTTPPSEGPPATSLIAATSAIGAVLFLVIVGAVVYIIIKYKKKRNQPSRPIYDEVGNYSDGMSLEQRRGLNQYLQSQVPVENPSNTDLYKISEEIYHHPTNNTLVRGLDNVAYAESESGDTIKGCETTSTHSATASTKSPPRPAPRNNSTDDSTMRLSASTDDNIGEPVAP